MLVALLHERNPDAFALLICYAPRLEAILARKFGPYIAADDLRDIVAEALLHAFDTGTRFNPALSQPITWLNMLAYYKALQFLRKRQHFTDTTLDELADHMAKRIEEEHPPVVGQPSARIEALIGKLSKRRARVVQMHYYDGLSLEEIAELLGISVGGIRSHLSRALGDLRRMLNDGCCQDK